MKKILNPRQIYALMLSSVHSTCENERFGHEISLGNFVSSSVHPDFERKNVLTINKFQQVCQSFFLPVQSTITREQILYWKKDSFANFFRLWAKLFLAWYWKTCGGVVRKAFFFQSSFFGEQIRSKNLWFFNYFRTFRKNVLWGNESMHSNCPRDQLWGKALTWKSSNFHSFQTLSENFSSW